MSIDDKKKHSVKHKKVEGATFHVKLNVTLNEMEKITLLFTSFGENIQTKIIKLCLGLPY
jgi:hypothetical protein